MHWYVRCMKCESIYFQIKFRPSPPQKKKHLDWRHWKVQQHCHKNMGPQIAILELVRVYSVKYRSVWTFKDKLNVARPHFYISALTSWRLDKFYSFQTLNEINPEPAAVHFTLQCDYNYSEFKSHSHGVLFCLYARRFTHDGWSLNLKTTGLLSSPSPTDWLVGKWIGMFLVVYFGVVNLVKCPD